MKTVNDAIMGTSRQCRYAHRRVFTGVKTFGWAYCQLREGHGGLHRDFDGLEWRGGHKKLPTSDDMARNGPIVFTCNVGIHVSPKASL